MKATRISDESHVGHVDDSREKIVVHPDDPAVKQHKPRRMTVAYFDDLLARSKAARERGRLEKRGADRPYAPEGILGFMGAAAAMSGMVRSHRRGRKGGWKAHLIDPVAPSETIAKMNAGGAYDVILDGKVTHRIYQGDDQRWCVVRVGRNGWCGWYKTAQEAAARYKLRVDKWA